MLNGLFDSRANGARRCKICGGVGTTSKSNFHRKYSGVYRAARVEQCKKLCLDQYRVFGSTTEILKSTGVKKGKEKSQYSTAGGFEPVL